MNGGHKELLSKREYKRLSRLSDSQVVEELLDYGFGYHNISEATKVSVPTLKRQAHQAAESDVKFTTAQRNRLLEFIAFASHIQGRYGVEDVASWFESKIDPNVALTPLNFYSKGAEGLLLCILRKEISTEDAFLVFDAHWKAKYTSIYEVFTSQDGQLSIREK